MSKRRREGNGDWERESELSEGDIKLAELEEWMEHIKKEMKGKDPLLNWV